MKKDEFTKKFGLKIKKIRKANGLSQEELAEKIDKTVDTVSSIERGLSSPRIETAIDLSQVLDVPLHELFQVSELPVTDKERMELLEEINDLLKTQTPELLRTSLEQIKQLIAFGESTSEKRKD